MGATMIRRQPEWVISLDELIRKNEKTPFKYGDFDCCLFVCDAIQAMTGVDVAADFRGKYQSEIGAAKFMLKFAGVRGIAEMVAGEHGLEKVGLNFAGRGDGVYFEPNGAGAVGIISTCGKQIVAAGEVGCVFFPKTDAKICWRIP